MTGPVLAERQAGGTPWHAHHIAERHRLFAIIALGEGVVGTVAALSAVVDRQGWTLDAVLVGIAGIGLTFGMWWVYYLRAVRRDPPATPRSSAGLGLRPDAGRHLHRRDRRGAACRGLLHRRQGQDHRGRCSACRRRPGRRLPRIDVCAVLLSGSTFHLFQACCSSRPPVS